MNNQSISTVTHFYDNTYDASKSYNYFVGSIVKGVEVENSSYYFIAANTPILDGFRVQIRPGASFRTVYVGDLNGGGKLDFVIARDGSEIQTVEAYLHDGTYLWTLNLGHNSINRYIIEPGATTVNVGQIDGINVFDLDGDGKAEVYIRIANNFTFGDGYVFTHENDVEQWVASVDGMTRKLLQKAKIPDMFLQHGPMGTLFGTGWLSHEKPSLIVVMKNRDSYRRFYNVVAAYSYTNGVFKMDWN